MATHDIDQKLLGRLAKRNSEDSPAVSNALFKILGLSVLLARRLVRARSTRKFDSSRDSKTLALYHHIIWLSREGLSLLETFVIPNVGGGQLGPELRIFAAKLRASFYHVFCLFHNQPPVSQLAATPLASPRHGPAPTTSPLSPRNGNGQKRRMSPRTSSPKQSSSNDKENPRQSPSPSRIRRAALRDTIPSMISEASYITNPYATMSPPPGLSSLVSISNPSGFLIPAHNYIPITRTIFDVASNLAAELLPGSSALRLSVALEHCAFLWDCGNDRDGSRRLARKTIRDVYRSQEGMDDEEFEDSAILVGTLGRMMRRKSQEGTPRFGDVTPPPGASLGASTATHRPQLPVEANTQGPQAEFGYIPVADPSSSWRPQASAPPIITMPAPGFDIPGRGATRPTVDPQASRRPPPTT